MNKERDFDNYIVQLVVSIRESARNLPDPNVMSEFDEESLPEELKMFSFAERFIHVKAKPIFVITIIDTAALPVPDKLTNAQTVFLCDEMIRLLNAYLLLRRFS